ncbi:carbohydrate kinase family protein [Methanobrevibacter curvatus]|uniref:Putative sugar kinase YdjH n=1 Tax=Methanobrevibacter curvatus TaxID=49547 RepID=A0A166AXK9_9EURY|nr:PfkB family carbohydrate kinase [Methanobrevibacter curvatus]KZX12602.1 putative sugar kinase YdjH [Methanobrevibacter curvatus]
MKLNEQSSQSLDKELTAEVIGFGALNLDKIFKVNEIVDKDGEGVITESKISCGGSASNTIIGLSRLGILTSYIGKIAFDNEGETLEMNLIKEGVLLDNLIYGDTGDSGVVYGFVDEEGDRSLYVNSGVNDEIVVDEIIGSGLSNAKIIHYSSFVGDSLNAQIDLIDNLPKSIVLSFDPGMIYANKDPNVLKKILKRTNILLINENELKLLFGEHYFDKHGLSDFSNKDNLSFRDIALYLIEDGIDTVVVKRGRNGAYGINNKEEVKIPVFNVEAIDTTAAGDSFNAGFLYSYLNNFSLEKSCIVGNWIASKSVEGFGIDNLPYKLELNDFIKDLNQAIINQDTLSLFE